MILKENVMAKSYDSHVKNHLRAIALAARIKAAVERGAGKGLKAGASFLNARVKEAISVPAPRRRSVDKLGNMRYVATTPAIAGAPIRKLSSRARTAQTWMMITPQRAAIGNSARSDRGFNYPRYHELELPGMPGSGKHKYVRPTYERYKGEVAIIVGGEVKRDFLEEFKSA